MTDDPRRQVPEFGLGLVSLGRQWGFRPSPLPTCDQVEQLLTTAVGNGVRIFDTAPAYGTSELLTGEFFSQLAPATRRQLRLATKCGEHWVEDSQTTYVDHSYDALVRSIDQSLERLGAIEVLQIHKTSVSALRSPELWRALEYARSCGITTLGASVSDLETGRLALTLDTLSVIQMPFNLKTRYLEGLLNEANELNRQIWTNRPFAMGELAHHVSLSKADAYRFIVSRSFGGCVLTGTTQPDHLLEDLRAFQQAI